MILKTFFLFRNTTVWPRAAIQQPNLSVQRK